MKNEILNLEFSPDVLAALKIGIDELGQEIKLLAAIYYFQENFLSIAYEFCCLVCFICKFFFI